MYVNLDNEFDKLEAKYEKLMDLEKFKEAIACHDKLIDIYVKERGIKDRDIPKITTELFEGFKKNPFYLPSKEARILGLAGNKKALVRYELACSLVEEERYEEALEWFNSLLEMFSSDHWILRITETPEENAPERHEVLVKKGHMLRQLGKYAEALECYDLALKINPKYHEAYLRKGDVLYDLRRDEMAIATFDQGLKIFKPSPSVDIAVKLLGAKAYVLKQHEKYEEAVECYDKALMYDPHDDRIYASKIAVLHKLGKHEEIIATFDKLFKNIPNYTGTINHIEIYYNKLLETNPNNVDILYKKGQVLYNLGEYEEAVATFDKLLVINPNHYGGQIDKKHALEKLSK